MSVAVPNRRPPRCRCGHDHTEHGALVGGGSFLDPEPCQTCVCPGFHCVTTENVADRTGRL
jgi:hypothetical protein